MSDRRPPADGYPLGGSVTLEQLAADPYPILAELRKSEPVSWLPAIDGWLVTSREAAIQILRDSETFTVDDPRFSTAQVIGPSMLSLDGAEHARHRMPFADPFRAAEVRRRLERWTTDRAGQLVDEVASRGRAELRSEFAEPLAADVMTQALGLEGLQTSDLLEIYRAIVEAVDAVTAGGEVPQRGRLAFEALRDAVVATIHNSSDSLPALVRTRSDLTDDEIASNIAVLLFGGVVTSEATIATVLFHVLGDESVRDRVASDRSLVRGAVEEAIRIEPAAAVVDRYATQDIAVDGAEVGEADLVRVSLTAAGRDPLTFAHPDRFELQRANPGKHLAFARGPHVCLGMHLARLEASIALDAVLSALPGVRLDWAHTRPPEGLIFRGPERVTATWKPS